MVIARTCDPRTPYNPDDFAYPRVWCKCGVEVAGANWGEKPTAIAAWNRRAPSPELLAASKKLEELEAALETASIALITGLMTLPVPVTGQGKRAWSTMIDARDAIDAALPQIPSIEATHQHTTGPWGYQVPMGPEILSIVTNPDGEAYEWVHVAQIGTDPVEGEAPITFAEHEANARLIAAAPDMLVALLAAELVLSQGAAREGSLVLLGIRAALAKAQGK